LDQQLVIALQTQQASSLSVFSTNGIFAAFPCPLPNLICAAILMISMTAGYLLLIETHPELQSESTQADCDNSAADTPLLGTSGTTADAGADLGDHSYGTSNDVATTEKRQ